VQVRVGGDFRRKELAGDAGLRRAGLLLSGGEGFVRLERCAGVGDLHLPGGAVVRYSACIGLPGRMTFMSGPSLGKSAYLRLERRGEVLTWAFRETGKAWWSHDLCKQSTLRLPRRLKFGVVAEATAPGTFEPWFDQFELTPLGGKAR